MFTGDARRIADDVRDVERAPARTSDARQPAVPVQPGPCRLDVHMTRSMTEGHRHDVASRGCYPETMQAASRRDVLDWTTPLATIERDDRGGDRQSRVQRPWKRLADSKSSDELRDDLDEPEKVFRPQNPQKIRWRTWHHERRSWKALLHGASGMPAGRRGEDPPCRTPTSPGGRHQNRPRLLVRRGTFRVSMTGCQGNCWNY